MKKNFIALIGMIISGVLVYMYMASKMNKAVEYWEAENVVTTVEALNSIKTHNTDIGLEILESRLNGSLLLLNGDSPTTIKEGVKAIQIARDYRRKFPYNDKNSNVSKAVDKIIELDTPTKAREMP